MTFKHTIIIKLHLSLRSNDFQVGDESVFHEKRCQCPKSKVIKDRNELFSLIL